MKNLFLVSPFVLSSFIFDVHAFDSFRLVDDEACVAPMVSRSARSMDLSFQAKAEKARKRKVESLAADVVSFRDALANLEDLVLNSQKKKKTDKTVTSRKWRKKNKEVDFVLSAPVATNIQEKTVDEILDYFAAESRLFAEKIQNLEVELLKKRKKAKKFGKELEQIKSFYSDIMGLYNDIMNPSAQPLLAASQQIPSVPVKSDSYNEVLFELETSYRRSHVAPCIDFLKSKPTQLDSQESVGAFSHSFRQKLEGFWETQYIEQRERAAVGRADVELNSTYAIPIAYGEKLLAFWAAKRAEDQGEGPAIPTPKKKKGLKRKIKHFFSAVKKVKLS